MKIMHIVGSAMLLTAAPMIAYGIVALRAAVRSSAHGGGLPGAFGLLPQGFGIVAGCVGVAVLLIGRPGRQR